MKTIKKSLLLLFILSLLVSASACQGKEPANQENENQNAATVTEDSTVNKENENQTEADNQETVVHFDASSSFTVEETAEGIKYTFKVLPKSEENIQALLEYLPLTDRHNTAALFIVSLVQYIENSEAGLAMIDTLKGPQPLSDADKSFIQERLSDKLYLPKAYFEGAVPENNYVPDEPWVLIIYDDPVAAPEGYSYVNVRTSGAENPRRICMRIKDDNHYLWEYNGILLSIKLPAEEDPWL